MQSYIQDNVLNIHDFVGQHWCRRRRQMIPDNAFTAKTARNLFN